MGVDAAAAAGEEVAAAAAGLSFASSTSAAMMRPPGPVPTMPTRLTPCCAASAFAYGLAGADAPADAAAIGGGGGAAAAAGGAATAAGWRSGGELGAAAAEQRRNIVFEGCDVGLVLDDDADILADLDVLRAASRAERERKM